MLQHYSPFKVAETFRVLASLAPGRVDLGIGKAPGGLPLTTRALQGCTTRRGSRTSRDQFAELDAFLEWRRRRKTTRWRARWPRRRRREAPRAHSAGRKRRERGALPRSWAGSSATPAISTATRPTSSARSRPIARRPAARRCSRCTPSRRRHARRGRRQVGALRIFKLQLSTRPERQSAAVRSRPRNSRGRPA